jgi:hypothetical protein
MDICACNLACLTRWQSIARGTQQALLVRDASTITTLLGRARHTTARGFLGLTKAKDADEPQSFVGKWRKSDAVGQIPCVMGACYGITRDWYMNGLRRPWQYGTGWGCDEELISAATWLRGGISRIAAVCRLASRAQARTSAVQNHGYAIAWSMGKPPAIAGYAANERR